MMAKVFQGKKYFTAVATLTGSQGLMNFYSKSVSALSQVVPPGSGLPAQAENVLRGQMTSAH